jgi:RNA polymerase sigma factor (sigma-70 family)
MHIGDPTSAPEAEEADTTSDDAFALVYASSWVHVYRYAYLLMRHRENAEDAAAEAFERAYSAWSRGRRPSAETLPWLLLITRRVIIDRERRSRLIRWIPLPGLSDPAEASGPSLLDKSELWLWFQQISRVLSPKQRDALILRFQLELSYEGVGLVMALSPANARTLVSRALAELKRRPESMR